MDRLRTDLWFEASEVIFFGYIISSWAIDHPGMSIGQVVDALNFSEEEMEYVFQWFDATEPGSVLGQVIH